MLCWAARGLYYVQGEAGRKGEKEKGSFIMFGEDGTCVRGEGGKKEWRKGVLLCLVGGREGEREIYYVWGKEGVVLCPGRGKNGVVSRPGRGRKGILSCLG